MTLSYINANAALPALLHRVMTSGKLVESRNGKTRELTMQQITLQDPVSQKEITASGRRVSLPAQVAETMWILSGRNDIDWIGHYLPRAAEFSDDNKVWRGGYGPRLRHWDTSLTPSVHDQSHVDQLAHIVSLLREDPSTRRAVFNIYDPAIDSADGKDIPCNNWVHFLPRDGVLHAHVAIRSNDLFWGWSGINAFEWTSLLQVVAGMTRLKPGSVTFSISSLHLYERHWGKASDIVSEAAGSSGPVYRPAPGFVFVGDSIEDLDSLLERWFQLEGQIRKGGLSAELLHQVATFPEPMFRSWLHVLLAWHHDDMGLMKSYQGTALYDATALSPKRKKPEPAPQTKLVSENQEKFTEFVNQLHKEKNAAYGNSWMKRGEMLGIMANCARKVDRLGVSGAGDTAADTAIDLLVYFIKYDLWLEQQKHNDWQLTEGQSHIDAVQNYLETLANEKHTTLGNKELIHIIKEKFDNLEHLVTDKVFDRDHFVKELVALTYPLAIRLWAKEQREAANAEGAAIDAWWKAGNATRSFTGYNV